MAIALPSSTLPEEGILCSWQHGDMLLGGCHLFGSAAAERIPRTPVVSPATNRRLHSQSVTLSDRCDSVSKKYLETILQLD